MTYVNRTPLLGLFYETNQLRNTNWSALDALISGAFGPGSPIQLPPGYGTPPTTGLVYGRGGTSVASMAWRAVLPLVGGSMAGDITLARDPTLALHAVTKQYVDWVFTTNGVYRGDWQVASNTPDLNTLVPAPVAGDRWMAITVDPNVPELPPPGIPGIDPTILIAQGTWIQRNAANTAWAVIPGGGLTKYEADRLYLSLTGGTLTGGLDIAMPAPRLTFHETNLLNPTLAGMRWIRTDLTESWGVAVDWPGRRLLVERRDLVGALVDVPFEIAELDGVAAFAAIPTAVGIPLTQDVPIDTVLYARQDRTWVDVVGALDAVYVNVVGDRMTGPLFLAADPVFPLQAATKQYVDGMGGVVSGDVPPPNPNPNMLWFDSTDGSLYIFYADVDSSQWVEVSGGGSGGATTGGLSIVGDVKQGFQTADHNGWVKLDGRLVSTLPASQQVKAALLGFPTNLPDATSAVPLQNGGTLGSITGAMSRVITQANLPNVTLTASTANPTSSSAGAHTHTASSAGAHTHSTDSQGNHRHNTKSNDPNNSNQNNVSLYNRNTDDVDPDPMHNNHTWWNSDHTDRYAAWKPWHSSAGAHTHTAASAGAHTHPTDSQGAHTHTLSHNHTVALGGTATAFDLTPRALTVNVFLFLGP